MLEKVKTILMKRIICMVLVGWASASFAQVDTLHINGFKFVCQKIMVKTEYDKMDTLVKLYRIENGNRKYVLEYYAYLYSQDCNNEFIDTEKMSIQKDCILFSTDYFQKTGLDPLPIKRKQIYKVTADGTLQLIYDKLLEKNGKWHNTNNSN
jgi:hypothetical protein